MPTGKFREDLGIRQGGTLRKVFSVTYKCFHSKRRIEARLLTKDIHAITSFLKTMIQFTLENPGTS